MVQLIKSYNKESVFHRAFDCVTDINEAMQTLIEIGVDRVLTSGLKSTAIAGAETIQYLQKEYGEQMRFWQEVDLMHRMYRILLGKQM